MFLISSMSTKPSVSSSCRSEMTNCGGSWRRIRRASTAVAAVDTPDQRWQGPFRLPAAGRVSSGYGHPRTVNARPWAWHKGVDVAAPVGSTVTAPAAGVVALAGTYPVQGGTVVIDHGQGLMSALFHLGEVLVADGDAVAASSPVARVGEGGFSTGAHVHWGVYVHGAAVDPAALLDRGL